MPSLLAENFVFKIKSAGCEYKCEANGNRTESKVANETLLLLRIINGTIETKAIALKPKQTPIVYDINSPFENFSINTPTATVLGCSFSKTQFFDHAIFCTGKTSKLKSQNNDYTLFKTINGVETLLNKTENGEISSAILAKVKVNFKRAITKKLNVKQPDSLDLALQELKKIAAPGFKDITPQANPDTFVLSAKFAKDQIDFEISPLDNDISVDASEICLDKVTSSPKNGSAKIISKTLIAYKTDSNKIFTGDEFNYRIISVSGAVSNAAITILPEPPVALDDNVINSKNQTVEISPLENDTDPWSENNDGMELLAVEMPQHGSAKITGRKILYTPEQNYVGTDTFKYRVKSVSGSEAEASIFVLTSAPLPANDKAYTLVNTPVEIRPLDNDSDPCGFPLRLISFNHPSFGTAQKIDDKTLLYTPVQDFKGVDSFDYIVDNGYGAEAAATITVYVGGDPVANDDNAYTSVGTQISISVITNDSDIPGAEPYVAAVGKPSHGIASLKGNNILYSPDTDWTGQDSFDYTLSNIFGGTAKALVTVIVDYFVVKNDTAKTKVNKKVAIEVLSNDSSAVGLPITIKTFSNPLHGTIELSETIFIYTPGTDFTGSDSFTYTASNGYETKTAKVNIYVGEQPTPTAWICDGDTAEDNFGYSADFAGDVNRDGYADIIVAAPHWDGPGYVKLFLGSETGAETTAAWRYDIPQSGAFPGFVAGGGDFNGDGYADFAIGAPLFDSSAKDSGKVYVFYGGSNGPKAQPDKTFEETIEGARFGRAVCVVGDVNGDGYSDLAVGAPCYSNGEQTEGKVYVYYGSSTGLASTPSWTKEGSLANAQFGFSVAYADINNDGYDDLIVGAKGFSNGEDSEGAAFIFSGSKNGLSQNYSWKTESNVKDAEYGSCVSSLGDINGDGIEDIGIGAWLYSVSIATQGAAYIYQSANGTLPTEPYRIIEGSVTGGLFGYSISGAGDINVDGYFDIIIGAPAGKDFLGRAYLYKGINSGIETNPFWSKTGDAYGDFGYCAKFAGDINNDGYADIIITAPFYKGVNGSNSGRAYLFYGNYDIK